MKNIQEIFKNTRNLVAKGWTQGTYARDANGNPSKTLDDPEAVCFCISGAMSRACFDAVDDENRYAKLDKASYLYDMLMDEFCLKNFMPNRAYVVEWNDSRLTTQADVLVALDRCIYRHDAIAHGSVLR